MFLGQKNIILSRRPARIIGIVDNPGAGSSNYRLSEPFFQQCIALRELLRGECNGQEA